MKYRTKKDDLLIVLAQYKKNILQATEEMEK